MGYLEQDLSGSTNPAVYDTRLSSPIGTLMHTTSGINSGAVLQGLPVAQGDLRSAHVLIQRSGARQIIVRSDHCAYHSGRTWFPAINGNRMDGANEVLLGIELECLDTQAPTVYQYDSAAEYITDEATLWAWRWPFVLYGHYGLAIPVGRRSDPIRFDWGAFMGFLYTHSVSKHLGGI